MLRIHTMTNDPKAMTLKVDFIHNAFFFLDFAWASYKKGFAWARDLLLCLSFSFKLQMNYFQSSIIDAIY